MPVLPVLAAVAVGLFLLGYLVLFYAVKMPSLRGMPRGELLFVLLFRCDELMGSWFPGHGHPAIFDRLPILAVAAAIVIWSACLGWLLIRLAKADRRLTRLEVFVFSTAVGLNAVSTYVLAVGLVGLVQSRAVFVVPAIATIGGAWWLYRRRGQAFPDKPRSARAARKTGKGDARHNVSQSDWLDPRWLWLIAPFTLVILLGGMLPPIEFDVREYHLQVPKEFYEQGHVDFLPHNVYGNMPMGTEMFSLLGMSLSGDWWLGALVGKTLICLFAPLTALGLFAAGRRLFSSTAGVLAAVCFISVPWIVQVSTFGLVEGASACYLFLAAYAVVLAGRSITWEEEAEVSKQEENRGMGVLLMAGYLAGGAVSCKYPAVLFVVFPLAVWVFCGARLAAGNQFTKSTSWKPLGVFLLAALLGCGLWLGKNWAVSGNPTYPLLYGVFGGRTWTPEKDRQWNDVHRPKEFSAKKLGSDVYRVAIGSEWLSPILLPLAALAFLMKSGRRLSLVLLAYLCFVIAGWWLLTHRIDRFWIPTLPLLALLAGVGACRSRNQVWRVSLIGLLVLGLGSNLLVGASPMIGDNRYFVPLEQLRTDPARVDPWHRYFNTHVPQGKLLMVGDAQVFDLEVPIFYSTCFDDSLFEQLVKGHTIDEIRTAFAAHDISHVYVHWGEINRYRSPGNYGFSEFVQPAVFQKLVEAGVLEPLLVIPDHPGCGYRVATSTAKQPS